jgi:hypothetical protein
MARWLLGTLAQRLESLVPGHERFHYLCSFISPSPCALTRLNFTLNSVESSANTSRPVSRRRRTEPRHRTLWNSGPIQ